MGCTTSHELSVPEDAYSKNVENGVIKQDLSDEYFSQHQKHLLRDTWKVLGTDVVGRGIAIFACIFDRKPSTKDLFPFRHLTGDELLQNPLFRGHATRFLHAVETTIQSLDALDVAVVPVFIQLGRKHIWIDDFLDGYLPVFMGAILDVFVQDLGKQCTNQVREAWGQMGKFIATTMTQGYLEAKAEAEQKLKDNNTINKDQDKPNGPRQDQDKATESCEVSCPVSQDQISVDMEEKTNSRIENTKMQTTDEGTTPLSNGCDEVITIEPNGNCTSGTTSLNNQSLTTIPTNKDCPVIQNINNISAMS